MRIGKRNMTVSWNSPVILGFSLLCLLAWAIYTLTGLPVNRLFFSVYRSSLLDPLTYVRFFGHVLGHTSWEHLFSNITLLLIIGPMLEEKYGSANILFVILTTALVTGVAHFILFPHARLLGASGVVFAMIMLTSFSSFTEGSIPMTFLLVAAIYIGREVYGIFFVRSNVSNLTHILGGVVGAWLGFVMAKHGMGRYR